MQTIIRNDKHLLTITFADDGKCLTVHCNNETTNTMYSANYDETNYLKSAFNFENFKTMMKNDKLLSITKIEETAKIDIKITVTWKSNELTFDLNFVLLFSDKMSEALKTFQDELNFAFSNVCVLHENIYKRTYNPRENNTEYLTVTKYFPSSGLEQTQITHMDGRPNWQNHIENIIDKNIDILCGIGGKYCKNDIGKLRKFTTDAFTYFTQNIATVLKTNSIKLKCKFITTHFDKNKTSEENKTVLKAVDIEQFVKTNLASNLFSIPTISLSLQNNQISFGCVFSDKDLTEHLLTRCNVNNFFERIIDKLTEPNVQIYRVRYGNYGQIANGTNCDEVVYLSKHEMMLEVDNFKQIDSRFSHINFHTLYSNDDYYFALHYGSNFVRNKLDECKGSMLFGRNLLFNRVTKKWEQNDDDYDTTNW